MTSEWGENNAKHEWDHSMRLKQFALAAGVLLALMSTAAAAIVTNPLNLRRGPGTGFGVITIMPPGARVDVIECGGDWCRVAWRGIEGFASASYLAEDGAYAYAPPPVYFAPPPVVSFGFGWGPRWSGYWGGGGRGHWGHGRGRHH
jgi:uncharacterized protein YraI